MYGSGGGRENVLLATSFCPPIPDVMVQVYFCGVPLSYTQNFICFKAKFPVLAWDRILDSQSYCADLSNQVGFDFRQGSR